MNEPWQPAAATAVAKGDKPRKEMEAKIASLDRKLDAIVEKLGIVLPPAETPSFSEADAGGKSFV